MKLNTDFKAIDHCIGRDMMPRVQRWLLDLVCRFTGHLLHQPPGSRRTNPSGSIDYKGTYCRRCFRSGYVEGEYFFP